MPEALRKLVESISFLPGIGEKTAAKLAFFLLKANPAYVASFRDSLDRVQNETSFCPTCGALMDKGRQECGVCADPSRDATVLCVVEDWLDMIALEKTGAWKGRYHVLGGAISPSTGVAPRDLSFDKLFSRVKEGAIKEVAIATNPNFEGEATAMYAKERLDAQGGVRVTRLSRGLPNSGYIEYADEATLLNALRGRRDM